MLTFAGQAVLDDISAATYNVVFTSLPILLYALLDRHATDKDLLEHKDLYAAGKPALRQRAFWMDGVVLGLVHGELL